MEDPKTYFKDKKITMMGLGLLGRGIAVAKFLSECGAHLLITDLKTKEQLEDSLEELKEYKNTTYVLGEHRLEDFEDKDMIIKSAGVPLDSPYITHAREKGIPIEMDASLFARLAPPGVILVGVTGTKGKSTVTHFIHHILTTAGRRSFLGGNVRGRATLPLLKEIKAGDYVVLELDSWQLQGFGNSNISPHIAVFTNFMPDHMNYYKDSMEAYFADKAHIFAYQKEGDLLVVSKQALYQIQHYYKDDILSTVAITQAGRVPRDWNIQILGEHMKENIALGIQVGEFLRIEPDTLRKATETFGGVEGRLQYLGEIQGKKVYNDNNATVPEATIASIEALKSYGPLTLIIGGADKKTNNDALLETIKRFVEKVVLIPGTGTDLIRFRLYDLIGTEKVFEENTFEDIVHKAFEVTPEGGVVLFSPAMASFGMFTNEYERNDEFIRIVKEYE